MSKLARQACSLTTRDSVAPYQIVRKRSTINLEFFRMARFIFFTKTRWNEPPRLRHQLAELLANSGNEVLFAEHPYRPGQLKDLGFGAPSRVRLFRHGELLHHKLRVGPIARWANAIWTSYCINKAVGEHQIDTDDVIVNFNYDYYFLREIFPHNAIITIINDDFVTAPSKTGVPCPRLMQASLARAQRMTCSMSDAVLTPSVALQDQLAAYCSPELFMPWADIAYRQPSYDDCRQFIVYWGYIGRRLDYPLISTIADRLAREQPAARLIFVGPLEGDAADQSLFKLHSNVEVRKPTDLDELPLNSIIGSIIPYVRGVPDIDVIVLPNKAMQLLARGLPLLITGMPRFMEAPFVFRLDEGDPVITIRHVAKCFEDLQPPIKKFVDLNGPMARLDQFMAVVRRVQKVRSSALKRNPPRAPTK
jgi:hypothetical protein